MRERTIYLLFPFMMITNRLETTSFISLPKKVVLLTYQREEEDQYFYNCAFNIPTDIPPGPTGSYVVVFNEALFQNTHPILENGDYLRIHYGNETHEFTIQNDVYSIDVQGLVSSLNSLLSEAEIPMEFFVPTSSINGMGLRFKATGLSPQPFNIEYSINFGYIFNNINKDQSSNEDNEIVWPLVRLTGPYTYIIRANMIPEVPTLNEMGQTYNMALLTYNVTNNLGEFVQMASTMRCITKNISMLKIALIDDQGRYVRIASPIYLQVTIAPYIPYKENMSYYKN